MKLQCQACGHENELGRIFCGNCGKKIDMSQLSRATMPIERETLPLGRIFKWLLICLALFLVVVVGLAAWAHGPYREPSDAAQRRISAQNLSGRLAGARQALRLGGETSLTIDVDDINDYLVANYGGRFVSISASISEGAFSVRVVDDHTWTIFGYDIGPLAYSYQVRCVPAEDGFRVAGAAVGRLPLPGPLAAPAIQRMADVFENAELERELLKNLSSLEFEDDLIKVAFGP